MFTVGRIFAGWYDKKIDIRKLIYLSISLALFGVALLLADYSHIITILGVTLAGFAIAPIFPGLVSSTTSRVGFRHQANTIGIQIAAGVPLQCDEAEDFQTFRIGLFGLDKLQNIDRTVTSLAEALNKMSLEVLT